MRTILLLITLLFLGNAQAQNNNNTATTDGYWSCRQTWGNSQEIFNNTSANPSDYVKTIGPDLTVIQNLPEVYTNKIVLSNNSKINLVNSDHKISFVGSGAQIIPICDQGFVDHAIIDFATTIRDSPQSLSGFLHGLNVANLPTADEIADLRPNLWRVGNKENFIKAYDLLFQNVSLQNPISSARIHLLLYDEWQNWYCDKTFPTDQALEDVCITRQNTPYVPFDRIQNAQNTIIYNPQNITLYKQYLTDWFSWAVDARSNNNNNNLIDQSKIVWECWNEPDYKTYWEGDNSAWTPSNWPFKNDFFETYKAFYETITDSNLSQNLLKVAGPSLAKYSEEHMRDFLEFCLNNRKIDGTPFPLQVNVVTWHEISYANDINRNAPPNLPISSIKEHVKNFKEKFMNNPRYAPLNMQTIEINEIIAPPYINNPAATASYLAALEQAGIDRAARSCWPEPFDTSNCDECNGCYSHSLNHLFTFNNTNLNDRVKKGSWWVHKLYNDGFDNRVKSINIEPRSVVLASKEVTQVNPNGNSIYAQVLFGYAPKDNTQLPRKYLIQLNNINAAFPTATSNLFYVKLRKIPYLVGAHNQSTIGLEYPTNVGEILQVYAYNNTIIINTDAFISSAAVRGPNQIMNEDLYELSISDQPDRLPTN